MLSNVGDPADATSAPAPGLSVEVLLAAALFSAGAAVAVGTALSPQDPPTTLLLLGWPLFAVVGGVLADQRPGSSAGRVLPFLSLAPLLIAAWAAARFGAVRSPDLARATTELAAVLSCGVVVAVPWSFRPPARPREATALAGLAGVGAVLVAAGRAGATDGVVAWLGWGLVVLGSLAVWASIGRAVRADDRVSRRRLTWLLIGLASGGGVVGASALLWPGTPTYYATCAVLVIGAVWIGQLWQRREFRPIDEHLLDLGLAGAVLLVSVATAGLVWLGSKLVDRPSSETTTVFAALLTTAMTTPAALSVRGFLLARRYGTGSIAPADVAAITADLHAQTEPRDLLDKAARVVAAASGSAEVRILLGDDVPPAAERWVAHPLEIGGDRVGSLMVASPGPDGLEARQQQLVDQLLPTVALVARAVGLAVEAEHARQDVARERDAERKRVLGDLHDGLGPVLAGMSMRVQAALRSATAPEHADLLRDLADDLAASRTDLRRIVAGITPSTLDDGDLDGALRVLVDSFAGAAGSPKVRLSVGLESAVSQPVQVAVYRSVAEGITNSLRHARATTIDVAVRSGEGVVVVDVADDGVGGPIVPGVGLSSLTRRAESLGGRLAVCPGRPGTTLRLELPVDAGVVS
jgi:signal transduction histidine kinase